MRSRRTLIAAGLFLLAAGLIAVTARDPGLTWDEAIYFGRAAQYWGWFQGLPGGGLDAQAVARTWGAPDHPPLGSLWIAGAFAAFGSFLDMITAARLGAAVLFGLVVAAIFLWTAAKRDERTGLLAAGVFLLMPRVFADGHFANLEMMTLLLWLATVAAFERGIERRAWSVLCGLFFGLALLTKINGAFLPFVLVPWGLVFHGRKALRNVLCMALIGPAVFFAGWPLLWHFPVEGMQAYLANKTQRMLIPVHYLGTTYRDRVAPWHYPFVMLLATTPLPVFAGAAGGAWAAARRLRADWRGASFEALLLWAFAFPVLLLAAPGVPKYDGVRLMMPACPFLAILAAEGLAAGWDRLRAHPVVAAKPVRLRTVSATAAGVLAVWLFLPVAALHPYQLAYYGELAGGPTGARRLGFETTYWGDTFDDKALRFLNQNVPENGSVAFVAFGEFVWKDYLLTGDARQDITQADFERDRWDYLVVVPRQGMWDESVRAWMAANTPVWTNTLPGGVPICLIYKR
jgi:4-amino-4-deoxy-L-arabinose transferase-like glycosyltransferase